MAGSPDTPEVKATPEEIERVKMAEQQWQFYQEVGKPVASKYVEAVTGYRVGEDGTLEVVENGILNADGSAKTDASAALAGTEKAFAPAMTRVNPNSGQYHGALNDMQAAKQRSGAENEAGIRLGQQNRTLKGLENAVAMGRGDQVQAVRGLSELAGSAANKASQDATQAFHDQSADRYLLGQLAGTGSSVYMSHKGLLDGKDFKKKMVSK